MTLEKTPHAAGPSDDSWAERWRLSFEIDGLMKDELIGLMKPDVRRTVGRSGLFLYSEHSVLLRGKGEEIDSRDAGVAEQVEAFSGYLEELKDIGFGRVFDISHERTGVVARAAAHLGQVATSSLRRNDKMAAGRNFLSGPSTLLRLAIPQLALDRGVDIKVAQVQQHMNRAFYGNESGGIANEAERVRYPQTTIVPGKVLRSRLKDVA